MEPSAPTATELVPQLGTLMFRCADCLAAALADCTIAAGLNETRYRVLVTLARETTGECSQAELAGRLLQSESNLSTLLERMSGDGLIARARSHSDRRRSLIRLTETGQQTLARADQARSAIVARLLRQFSADDVEQMTRSLKRLVGHLERSLDTHVRRASGTDPAFGTNVTGAALASSPPHRSPSQRESPACTGFITHTRD